MGNSEIPEDVRARKATAKPSAASPGQPWEGHSPGAAQSPCEKGGSCGVERAPLLSYVPVLCPRFPIFYLIEKVKLFTVSDKEP